MREKYRVRVISEEAEDFFSLLLPSDMRKDVRDKMWEAAKIVASGTDSMVDKCSYILQKNQLHIYSNILYSGVEVCYENTKTQKDYQYDKIVYFRGFPGNFDERTEKYVTDFKKKKQEDIFLNLMVVLCSARMETGITDMNSMENAIEKELKERRKNYSYCDIIHIRSECEFREKIAEMLFPQTQQNDQIMKEPLLNMIKESEDRVCICNLKKYGLLVLPNEGPGDDIFSPEQIHKICKWTSVKGSDNLQKTYFDQYFKSSLCGEITDALIEYYASIVKDICIWNIEEDKQNLTKLIQQKLNELQRMKEKRVVKVKEKEMQYIIEQQNIFSSEFAKALEYFYHNTVWEIIKMYAQKRINQYKELLKS